jgi:hypothetical protein
MTNEVMLCGEAKLDGDSLRVVDLTMTYMRSTDTASVRGDACPSGTMVVLHNHPWTGPMEDAGITKPAELCSLGRTDRWTGVLSKAPWIAVIVGRADPKWAWLCWWSRSQLGYDPRVSLPAPDGQGLKFWSE